MESKTRIKGNVHYVGVNDRNKHRFEAMWPLPYGVSYNSYLIDDEMVALVDTVDICYFEVYLRKIKQVIGERPINYLYISTVMLIGFQTVPNNSPYSAKEVQNDNKRHTQTTLRQYCRRSFQLAKILHAAILLRLGDLRYPSALLLRTDRLHRSFPLYQYTGSGIRLGNGQTDH